MAIVKTLQEALIIALDGESEGTDIGEVIEKMNYQVQDILRIADFDFCKSIKTTVKDHEFSMRLNNYIFGNGSNLTQVNALKEELSFAALLYKFYFSPKQVFLKITFGNWISWNHDLVRNLVNNCRFSVLKAAKYRDEYFIVIANNCNENKLSKRHKLEALAMIFNMLDQKLITASSTKTISRTSAGFIGRLQQMSITVNTGAVAIVFFSTENVCHSDNSNGIIY